MVNIRLIIVVKWHILAIVFVHLSVYSTEIQNENREPDIFSINCNLLKSFYEAMRRLSNSAVYSLDV